MFEFFSPNCLGGRKPTYLTSATTVLTSVKAVSIVPSGGDKTDVRRENTDVRWVGFHPLKLFFSNASGSHSVPVAGFEPSIFTITSQVFYHCAAVYPSFHIPGIPFWRGRINTVDLLSWLVQTNCVSYCKASDLNEVNRTEPSPSVRIPWIYTWVLGQLKISCIQKVFNDWNFQPVKCQECNNLFQSYEILKHHQSIPFICQSCNVSFANSCKLLSHECANKVAILPTVVKRTVGGKISGVGEVRKKPDLAEKSRENSTSKDDDDFVAFKSRYRLFILIYSDPDALITITINVFYTTMAGNHHAKNCFPET